MINNENEKIENSNELNENDSLINDEEKNEENELEEEPIYVMTVELEKGKSESIKIFSNSKPEELAFSFCKKYNLDFSSLSYLSTQIKSLIENLPNGNDILEKNNEAIEEVDEENNPPSSEAPSKKFGSQSNSTNLSPGTLNNKRKMIDNDNFINNNNYDNNNIKNYENNDNIENETNNNYEKEYQKLKGLNPNNVKNYSNKPLSSLFNGFEYRRYLKEKINNKKENNKKNNKQNIYTYKNKIENNSGKKNNSNKNININNLSESSGNINNIESKNNLSGNIDFYKNRNKIFSYEKFYDEFKQNLINKKKEKESSTLFENSTINLLKQDSYSKNLNLDLDAEKTTIKSNNNKKKYNNKISFYFDSDLTLSKNKKNFDMFLNNCNLLDEIYQNKIDDNGVFLIKNPQNKNFEEPKRNVNLKEYNNFKLKDNKRYFDNDLVKLRGSNSFKKNNTYKKKEKRHNRNLNTNFSSSLTNSPKQLIYKKNNKSTSKIKSSSRNKNYLERKINPFKKSYEENFHSTNKDNKTLSYSLLNRNTNYIEKLSNREILYNENKDKAFKKIFNLLDSDNDGLINILSMETKGIPITIFNILSPIIQNIKNSGDDIKENNFVIMGRKLFNNLSFHERRALFNFTNTI